MNMHEFGIIFLYFHGVRAFIYSRLDTYTYAINNKTDFYQKYACIEQHVCIMHFLLQCSQLNNTSTMHLLCSFNLSISKMRIKNICIKNASMKIVIH